LVRKIELNKEGFCLLENEIEGFLERTVTPIGNSAKADVPRRYLGRRVYVIVTKTKIKDKEKV
jgi:putative transposon-encoded protein